MSTTTVPSEEVVVWRQKAGSNLARLWLQQNTKSDDQLLVIFGKTGDDRPLHTPLTIISTHDVDSPSDVLMQIATDAWLLPAHDAQAHCFDFSDYLAGWRMVIACIKPISKELARKMFEQLLDDIHRDLPDAMLYG